MMVAGVVGFSIWNPKSWKDSREYYRHKITGSAKLFLK